MTPLRFALDWPPNTSFSSSIHHLKVLINPINDFLTRSSVLQHVYSFQAVIPSMHQYLTKVTSIKAFIRNIVAPKASTLPRTRM